MSEPAPPTKRYKITIEYRGSAYSGWQKQPHVPSIQEEIERAVAKFSSQEIPVQVAGRTDAGVHARGQVAHFDLGPMKKPLEAFAVAKAINAHLGNRPISILRAEEVSPGFHARFDAVNKLYRYHILNRQGFLGLDQGLVWHIKRPLDVAAMQEASKVLLGHHDFSTFRDTECQAKSPMRTLDRLDITARDADDCGGVEILFDTEGKSFLHHQVRNMVGSLVMVGKGKWSAADLKAALEAKDRTAGGPTAPSDGLYLMRVDYENE